jgi:hypothetical protein
VEFPEVAGLDSSPHLHELFIKQRAVNGMMCFYAYDVGVAHMNDIVSAAMIDRSTGFID